VNGRVESSDVRSPRMSLDTTQYSIDCFSIEHLSEGITLPKDGNVMPKHEGATIHN
jgi:hypothetical protein